MAKKSELFINKINKNLNNNKKVYYSDKDNDVVKKETNVNRAKTKKNINEAINSIFTSSNYVYKALVRITLKDKVIDKKIIGKNNNHLITMNNELIPIDDILDIETL